MYKYIITWIVVSMQSAPCTDANRVSEFGTMNRSMISCAVYHTQTVKEKKERVFYSKDSANIFMKNINNYKPSGFYFSIEDKIEAIKLDSILTKKVIIMSKVNFGEAIEALKSGKLVTRSGWNGKGMFIVKQIPAEIGLETIPKLQSLPQSAKNKLIEKNQPINYANQMLIINSEGRADSWVPSSSDCFAEDWIILD